VSLGKIDIVAEAWIDLFDDISSRIRIDGGHLKLCLQRANILTVLSLANNSWNLVEHAIGRFGRTAANGGVMAFRSFLFCPPVRLLWMVIDFVDASF
jgi:hypothetical protein